MAEYYRIVERSELTGRIEIYIPDEFPTPDFNNWFWTEIKKGKHPEITEEIKEHFPSDFDFSGEEEVKSTNEMLVCMYCGIFPLIETCKHPEKCATKTKVKTVVESNNKNMSLFEKENQRKMEDENLQKRIYTQLAKEGKFNELPDTCEFSEPVELEVWDYELQQKKTVNIVAKFKSKFIQEKKDCIVGYAFWNFAQLHTKKIDFSQFKTGDIVEVDAFGLYYGYLESNKEDYIQLSFSSFSTSTRRILKKDIKSITILK